MSEEREPFVVEGEAWAPMTPRSGWWLDLRYLRLLSHYTPRVSQKAWRRLHGKRVRVTVEVLETDGGG